MKLNNHHCRQDRCACVSVCVVLTNRALPDLLQLPFWWRLNAISPRYIYVYCIWMPQKLYVKWNEMKWNYQSGWDDTFLIHLINRQLFTYTLLFRLRNYVCELLCVLFTCARCVYVCDERFIHSSVALLFVDIGTEWVWVSMCVHIRLNDKIRWMSFYKQ